MENRIKTRNKSQKQMHLKRGLFIIILFNGAGMGMYLRHTGMDIRKCRLLVSVLLGGDGGNWYSYT